MKVLIKQARINCTSSPLHGQVKDILIVGGILQSIEDLITAPADTIIEQQNLHVSIGWMDVFANFQDPGEDHKESLETGAGAAAAGGFTDVMLIPNTNPSVSSRSQVSYLLQKAAALPVNIHPIGTISQNAEGKVLSEMYDMAQSGAKAFSDGKRSVQSPGLLLKSLQYVAAIDGTIIQIPDDASISASGLMNEGVMSTRMGLPGKPAIAEELMVARDIELLQYTGSKLHITALSTEKSIALVAAAKSKGLRLTCSVTPFHYFFNDEDLSGYDTNLKVNPPLRSRKDMEAVRKAVQDGTIDCIASHHMPEHWDDKTCEFEYAKNGMIGLETLFGAINDEVHIDTLIQQLTTNPRNIFGISVPVIETGKAACLTLFDPSLSFVFEESMIRSMSRNTPFVGKTLMGKVYGIINGSNVVLNNYENT